MHSLENRSFSEILAKVETGLDKGLPFSVYRKPQDEELIAVFQSDGCLNTTSDFQGKGFVFAPFNLKYGAVLIQPDELLKGTFPKGEWAVNKEVAVSDEGRDAHLELVEKGIREIKQGKLKKVVLSRKMEIPLSQSPTAIFKTLLQRYTNAFCYFFYHPKIGTWCGATPETLVNIKSGELRTMSLAATLPFSDNEEPKWGDKEIEEQKMVSDYIREKLGHFMDKLEVDEAQSVRAGNLWHLKSEVRGTLLPQTGVKEIITALHPTPAVCGIPTQEAREFILEHENYPRTFYTGFLGELNLWGNKESSLFVNLRCMELKGDKATIYVGGGITAASDPMSEWIETQNKSKTMLGIL